ncbi:helicase [Aureococcus anophagefferens]|nr:helicase [Aureococcus anophagefferens]
MENGGRGGGGGGKGKGGPRKRTRSRGGRGRGGGGKGGDANAPPPAPGMDGSGRPPKVQAVAPPGAGPLPVPHKGARTSSTTRAHMTAARFDGYRGVVSDGTLKAIAEVLGYETMTKVQEQALPVCTRGRDVVAKAKTGTGKTLAFMIPCVDRAAASKAKRGGSKISALKDYRALGCAPGSRAPDILVATPGRLNDHLENSAGFARDTLGGLECLVFDEADQLLDMGFRPAIEQMLRAIQATRLTRQTLLFSATLPADVKGIAKLSMKDGSDYDFVDTVGDADEQTHSHVPQCCVVCEGKKLHSAELVARLADACSAPDHKVIVFFTTARLTQLYSELLVGLQGAQARGQAPDLAFLAKTRILEIHSRKSQSHRTKFGAPADAAQYVHRRTARAGKEGSGCLLLSDFEAYFLEDKAIKALPIAMQRPLVAGDATGAVLAADAAPWAPPLPRRRGAAYQAWLGFNSSLRRLRWDLCRNQIFNPTSMLGQGRLVAEANDWAKEILGMAEPPQLQAKTVGKMGLKGVRGLNRWPPALARPPRPPCATSRWRFWSPGSWAVRPAAAAGGGAGGAALPARRRAERGARGGAGAGAAGAGAGAAGAGAAGGGARAALRDAPTAIREPRLAAAPSRRRRRAAAAPLAPAGASAASAAASSGSSTTVARGAAGRGAPRARALRWRWRRQRPLAPLLPLALALAPPPRAPPPRARRRGRLRVRLDVVGLEEQRRRSRGS